MAPGRGEAERPLGKVTVAVAVELCYYLKKIIVEPPVLAARLPSASRATF